MTCFANVRNWVIIMMWTYNGNHMYFLGFGILVIIAILVANDANSTGRNGLLWGLITLFMPMMGLLIYLVVRNLPAQDQGYRRESTPQKTVARPQQQVVYQPIEPQTDASEPLNTGKGQFCTSCGAPNKSAAEFCNNCGSRILHE